MSNPNCLCLESLPTEIMLLVMKSLSTFNDLNSLTRTSSLFNLIFKSNEYGICYAIARRQFEETWDEVKNLIHHQKKFSDLTKQSSDEQRRKFVKTPSQGLLKGGTDIGVAEATALLEFNKKYPKWKESVARHIYEPSEHILGILSPDTTTPYSYMLTTKQTPRIYRALFRYYFLLLRCIPEWIEERQRYSIKFHPFNIFPEVIEAKEGEERKEMTPDEILERKRWRVGPFLQYKGQDLKDIYVVSKVWEGPGSNTPGNFSQEKQWSKSDDYCVQIEAEFHIKHTWRLAGESLIELLEPDHFYEL